MKRKKMNIVPALALLALSMSPQVFAENAYQFEANGLFSDTTSDSDIDSRIYGAAIKAYIAPVESGDYPYAENDFLVRKPNIVALAGRATLNMLSNDISGNMFLVGGGYSDTGTPLLLNFLYGQTSASGDINNESVSYDLDSKGVDVGFYIDDTTGIKISYTKTDMKIKVGADKLDGYTNRYDLEFKKVMALEYNNFLNVAGLISYTKDDEKQVSKEFGLLADYYFDKTLSLGAGMTITTSDDKSDEGKSIALRVAKFITPVAAVTFEFNKFLADENDNDSQTIELTGLYRF